MVRTDMDWQSQGTMAALAEDLSPIYLGVRGKYGRNAFTVIGRLQKQYDEGRWNEWLLLLDNERNAWLSEGSGRFYLTVLSSSTETLPACEALHLGDELTLAEQQYAVSNIETAACIATEGEIPFAINPGDTQKYVDLTGDENRFATLDYGDDTPQLYVGRIIELADLQLQLGDKPLAKQAAEDLRCASCGNASILQNPDSLVVACASCKVVNNLKGGKLIVAFSQATANLNPKIPLGTKGVIAGYRHEVIGFIVRNGGGSVWDEYLLYSETKGISWLICAYGHWSLVRSCAQPKTNGSNITFEGRTYKHHSSYTSTVSGVLGEFYWQVKKNESAKCADFICPPYVLSSEKTEKEIVWSEGIYIDADEVAAAFAIKKPPRSSVGINQPSPEFLSYLWVFVLGVFAAFMLGSLIHTSKVQTINVGSLALNNNSSVANVVSEPFTLNAPHGLFHVRTSTNVDNNWINFQYRLVNQVTGESRLMNREVAHYSGYDGDGYWSEGDKYDRASLSNITAGTYVVEVDAETDTSSRPSVTARIQASYGEGSTKNILLLVFALVIGPLLAGIYKFMFEKKRWDDSDHPWE